MGGVVRSIALIDPFGDYGIGGYTYELAEGLAANDLKVHVYTNGRTVFQHLSLPRQHELLPVLGSLLFRQRAMMRGQLRPLRSGQLATSPAAAGRVPQVCAGKNVIKFALRRLILPLELALHLKRTGYDLVWTQWPVMDDYGVRFWSLCKSLGLRLAHTVHDVLPHEEIAGYKELCQAIYNKVDTLVVHSNFSAHQLTRLFEHVDNKVIVARQGMYTMFTRRPEMRAPVRAGLRIGDNHVALLFFGAVRPYKNVESVLLAMRDERLQQVVLIVAGQELGYPDMVPGEPLGRTLRIAKKLGIADRVKWMPGSLDLTQTARVFEAADILVQPYLKSYGSALLLLGMTFGKWIVATATGGMDEYLSYYPSHLMLDGPESTHVIEGVLKSIPNLRGQIPQSFVKIPDLEWPQIARGVLSALEQQSWR